MDAVLQLIRDPGPVRWVIDGLVLPAIGVLVVILARAGWMRLFGPSTTAEEEGETSRVVRQTANLLTVVLSMGVVALIWQNRLRELARDPDGPFGGREDIVAWLGGSINALLATAVFALILVVIVRSHRYAVRRLYSWQQARKGVKLQGAMLITPLQVRQAAVVVLRILRFVAIGVVLYIYVPLLLSLLPATRPLADRIVPLVLDPVRDLGVAFVGYLPRLLSLILILIAVRYLLRLLSLIMGLAGRGAIRLPGFDPEWADQTARLAKIVVVLATAMILYPFLPGAGSEVFKGFSLFIGALFTLGASSSVSNLISGIILTYTRSFRIDDRISIGQATGDVISRGLFVTRIRTIYNEEVTVPNNVALGGRVVNYSAAARTGGLALRVTAGIGYEVDWRRVHELMKSAAASTEGVLEDPAPFVLQTELSNFAVAYELVAWTGDAKTSLRTESQLRSNVLDAFHEAGVEIMTPAVTALRNAPDVASPTEAATERPGAFRFLGLRPETG